MPYKEGKDEDNSKENPSYDIDELIGYKALFYYCKEHPEFENIYKKEVIHHIHYYKEDLKLIEMRSI
ncbi:MAG TPA: hypothetical protein VIY08_12235 [Candidatus Nitrosocosmicus sp.]